MKRQLPPPLYHIGGAAPPAAPDGLRIIGLALSGGPIRKTNNARATDNIRYKEE